MLEVRVEAGVLECKLCHMLAPVFRRVPEELTKVLEVVEVEEIVLIEVGDCLLEDSLVHQQEAEGPMDWLGEGHFGA